MKKEVIEFINKIEDESNQTRMQEVLEYVIRTFPTLKLEFKWNQPMFTDHGTFIIGFSVSKKHIAAAPESHTIHIFTHKFNELGENYSKMLVKFPWNKPFNFVLLKELIQFNIADKSECKTFWRK